MSATYHSAAEKMRLNNDLRGGKYDPYPIGFQRTISSWPHGLLLGGTVLVKSVAGTQLKLKTWGS